MHEHAGRRRMPTPKLLVRQAPERFGERFLSARGLLSSIFASEVTSGRCEQVRSSPGIELTGVSPRPEHAGASLGTASFGLPAGSLGDLRSARSISEFALT